MSRATQTLVVWGVLVLLGFGHLVRYSATAGTGDRGLSVWPDDASIVRRSGLPTLIVFLHPACPCSRASVEELSRLLAHAGRGVDCIAAFVRPAGFDAGWERTELWDSVARIPGVRCITDPGGEAARRFGASTSGYTALYDARGTLVFHGGITGARGHEGANAGENAILSWFRGETAEPAETPTFGCSLFDKG